jgi:carbonic anhydrase
MDYRFWPETIKIFKDKYANFDLIGLAGSAKNLASPSNEANRTTIIENIDTSVKLHKAKRLILINHVDCGAYGGSEAFANFEEELAFHTNELKKAKQIALDKFPELEVITVFMNKENDAFIPMYI